MKHRNKQPFGRPYLIKKFKEVTKFVLISKPISLEKVLFNNLLVKDFQDRQEILKVIERITHIGFKWVI